MAEEANGKGSGDMEVTYVFSMTSRTRLSYWLNEFGLTAYSTTGMADSGTELAGTVVFWPLQHGRGKTKGTGMVRSSP